MKHIKPRLILAIRIDSQRSRTLDGLAVADIGLRLASKWTELFSLKLRELGMQLPGFDQVYITTTISLPHLELVLLNIGTQVASFECGIDRARLPDSIQDRENLLLTILVKALNLIPGIEPSELEKAELAREQLLSSRLDLLIQASRIANSDFDAQVLFSAGINPKLILRLKDLRTGFTHCLHIVQLKDPRDAYWLVGKVQIKKDCIRIIPRSSDRVKLDFRNKYVLDLDAKGLLSKDISSIEIPLAVVLSSTLCDLAK